MGETESSIHSGLFSDLLSGLRPYVAWTHYTSGLLDKAHIVIHSLLHKNKDEEEEQKQLTHSLLQIEHVFCRIVTFLFTHSTPI